MTFSSALIGEHIPYSQEAEEATLGAIITNPGALLDVRAYLNAEDFFILRHQYIYLALCRLSDRRETIDYVTLIAELKSMDKLGEIGGPAYVTQLINSTPTSIHAEVYARLVQAAATRRRLLAAADRMRVLALNEQLTVDDVMVEAQVELDGVRPDDRSRLISGMESIHVYDEIQDDLAQRRSSGEMVAIPTPERWNKFREFLPYAYFGHTWVISGLPGSGKSTALETLAEWCAAQGLHTELIHTEMTTEEVLHRRACRYSHISYDRLAQGTLTEHEQQLRLASDIQISQFARRLAYHWMPNVRFEALAHTLKRHAMSGIKVFILDHFQDVYVQATRGEGEIKAIERACTWLAAFAEYRNVLLIIGSQENKDGNTKWASKLREKATVHLSIKRRELTNEYSYCMHGIEVRAFPGQDDPRTIWHITKARFGRKGKLLMLNHGTAFEFIDMSRVQKASYHEAFLAQHENETGSAPSVHPASQVVQ